MGQQICNFLTIFDQSQEFLNKFDDGITILDDKGVILRANKAFFDLISYPSEKVLGQNITEFIDPDSLQSQPPRFENFEGNDSIKFRREFINKNDEIIWVSITTRKIANLFFSIHREITDQIIIENKLKENAILLSERIKELNGLYRISILLGEPDITTDTKFHAIPDMITISYQNPNYTHCKIIINNEIYTSSHYKRGLHFQSSEIKLKNKIIGKIEVSINDNDEMDTIFLDEEVDLLNEIAEKIGKFLYAEHLNQQLIEKQKELLQTQKMKALGQLAGGVAHDLNNVLAVIQGYAEKISKNITGCPKNNLDDISKIKQNVDKASSLLTNLLTFAKRQQIKSKPVNINHKLSDVIPNIKRIIEPNIEIKLDLSEKVPVIEIDPIQFDQIIINLIINASQAMPHGGILSISTRVYKSQIHQQMVEIEVRDTGFGMNDETLERLFEPFYSTKKEGIGLGLSTTYGIVNTFHGRIDVVSQEGIGSSFHLHFPLTDTPSAVTVDETMNKGKKFNKENNHVYLIEDDKDILELLKLLLESEGYTVTASNTPLSIKKMTSVELNEIDLIITDIVMPDDNGVSLIKWIGTMVPDINYLYISGYSHDILEKYEEAYDEKRYLKKPFSNQLFQEKVSQLLSQ